MVLSEKFKTGFTGYIPTALPRNVKKKKTTVEKKKCPITSTSSSLSTPHFHFQNKTFLHDVLQHFKTVNPILFWESMKVKANMRSWWQAWGFSALSNGHCWNKTTNITFFKPTKPKYFFKKHNFSFSFFFKQQLFSTCFFLILTTELHRQTQILTQPHHR